ncbi:MAG: OmpA family protein [Acidisphaera sp.]|nr:OmpA family protein [Acidisphaera sp.]
MRLRSALLAATVLALPVAVKAQPVNGLYIGAGAGVNILQTEHAQRSPALGIGKTKDQSNAGFAGVGSVGYGLGNGLRFELEGDYRWNRFRHIEGTRFPTNAGGSQENYGAMGNVLYDFDIGMPMFYPYVGLGAGYMWTHFQNVHANGTNFPFAFSTNDTFGNPAYQAIIGASFPVPPIPGLSFTAEYRFMGLLNTASYHSAVVTPGHQARGNYDVNDDFNHSVLLGVRYAFGVAPPPPPPAPVVTQPPQPAPTRTYLVFFDWDRADLTDRARQIIGEAAQASTRVQYTRIEVNGYTDLSGTPQYNQRLSVRRAQSVAAELVRDGVPRQSINIQGFGETHPLVPTAQGVREPQNRRVEIIIR